MKIIFVLFFMMLLGGCAEDMQPREQLSWRQAMNKKLAYYTPQSKRHFIPLLHKDHLAYPPKQLAFLVFKRSKKVEVYAKGKNQQAPWQYVTKYPIVAASGGLGPKLHEGDYQVPEGIYRFIGMNPQSRFDLSMHVNYPDAFDLKEAQRDHRHRLGGNIYMHGSNRSVGCIALGDAAIQQIFPLVYYTGEQHVEVVIAPEDFRVNQQPVHAKVKPTWLPNLYSKIKQALRSFPLPHRHA